MAGNQEFFQALGQFQQGVADYARTQSVREANAYVDEIRNSSLKEEEKMQALRQVASSLTMQLASQGTPAAQIEQVYSSIAGPKPPPIQTAEQAVLVGTDEQRARGLALIEGERKARLTEKATGSGFKEEKETRASLMDFQKQFNKASATMTKARSQAEGALKLLQSGNKITPGAIGTLMARASGEVGNLTAPEREAFAGRQDIMSLVQRWGSIKSKSELPEEDKKALQDLAQLYLGIQDSALEDHALTLTNQALANPLLYDKGADTLVRAISGNKVRQYRDFNAPSAPRAPQTAGAPPMTPSPNGSPMPAAPGSLRSLLKPIGR